MIRAGDYPPAMPPYREEDTDMTKEEIQAMIDAAVTAARPPVYTSVENCPAWARETVQKAVDEGVLRGDQGGGLRLTDDNLVNLQMLRNLLKKTDSETGSQIATDAQYEIYQWDVVTGKYQPTGGYNTYSVQRQGCLLYTSRCV